MHLFILYWLNFLCEGTLEIEVLFCASLSYAVRYTTQVLEHPAPDSKSVTFQPG